MSRPATRRLLAAVALLAILAALAGCTSLFGPGEPDPERLAENATYDWDDNATASIQVNRSSYESVYRITNRSELEVYRRDALGRERRLPISALQFRYPNGTQITANASALSVSQTRQRTIVDLPNETNGSVAFTAPRHGKRFSTPIFVEGSYAVTLPRNARVGVPLLSQVSPGGYRTNVPGDSDRMTIRWSQVTSRQLNVRYYLERDLVLFTALVVAAVAIGGVGGLYYYRQIRRVVRRREQAGIDLEEADEDDDPRDRGPPPGMR